MRKLLIILAILLVVLFAAVGSLYYYVCYTPQGLRVLTDYALKRFVAADSKRIGIIDGTLATRAVFKDIEIVNSSRLPAGSTLKIQTLTATLRGLNFKNIDIKVENARLKLPVSSNIVLSGTIDNGVIKLMVFSPLVDVREIASLIGNPALKDFRGALDKLDFKITGDVKNPTVQGVFHVAELTRPNFSIKDAPGTVDLMFAGLGRKTNIKGQIALFDGVIKAHKTSIRLKPSKVLFSGDPKNPSLVIEAYSRVEDLNISIIVTGTPDKPDLKLTSDPPLSSDELMLTLATGRKWTGLGTLKKGQMSTDVVKDLVGYLFFSGSDDGFLNKMGISNVKVNFEKDKKSLGFIKAINNNVNVQYGVEQKNSQTNQPTTSQSIGAELHRSDHLSVSVERKQDVTEENNVSRPPVIDDKVLLKYKTKF